MTTRTFGMIPGICLLAHLSIGGVLFAGQGEMGKPLLAFLTEERPPATVAAPKRQMEDQSSLVIRLYASFAPKKPHLYKDIATLADLLLIDPRSRRVGKDPRAKKDYREIPFASYDLLAAGGAEMKEIDIRQPLAGEYQLQVIGTDTGTYDLAIWAYDPNHNESEKVFEDIPTSLGTVHSYGFYFAKTVGAEIEVSGGFDGGGQRPRDVNKFLSYISPSESQTTLPAGSSSFDLWIAYGKAVIPTTFTATLNGANVAHLFAPTPGTIQTVPLPLQSGRNVLVLSVEGNLPNRVATDTDRLVFVVP